jgi:hypothetical protein
MHWDVCLKTITYIGGDLVLSANVEKGRNGVDVDSPGDPDCEEGPEDEDLNINLNNICRYI